MEYEIVIRTVIITLITGSLCIVLADRTRLPVIILYFIGGIGLGPHGVGLIRPDSLGTGLNILITLFVGIILFEGGLSLNISRLKSIRNHLSRQILFTIVITMTSSWLAAVYIAGLPPDLALIFASLTIVTGPTVIKPIIHHLPLRRHVKTFLNGEAIIIDAVGAVLAIAIIEYFVSREVLGHSILVFVLSIITGIAVGAAFGFSFKLLLRKTSAVPVASRSIFTLGLLFCVFYVSELLSSESGLMAVAVFGIVLSGIDYREKEKLLSFKEQISRVVISLLFILLSANFNIMMLPEEMLAGMAVVGIIILARFPTVFASARGSIFTKKERLFMGWVGPRGIIALSVASVAIIKLKSVGVHNTQLIEILVFLLISVTVLLQGLSAGAFARRLGILMAGDTNIIILGINPTTLGMAMHWRAYQNDVLFVDSNISKCALAKKEGFAYLHGNGLAPDTFSGLDIDSYSSVLAASPNNEVNVLFCRFLKETYGVPKQYVILTEKAGEELSEIIQSEGIKTACIGLQGSGDVSFFTIIKDYFSVKKPAIRELTIKNGSFVQNKPGEYPLPDGVFILFAVRNQKDCYIYYHGFKLELDDTLYIVVHNEASPPQLDMISIP